MDEKLWVSNIEGVTGYCWLTTSDPDWPSVNESKGWAQVGISRFVNSERYYLFVNIPPEPRRSKLETVELTRK